MKGDRKDTSERQDLEHIELQAVEQLTQPFVNGRVRDVVDNVDAAEHLRERDEDAYLDAHREQRLGQPTPA